MRRVSIYLSVVIVMLFYCMLPLFAHEEKHPERAGPKDHWKAPSQAARKVNPVPYEASSIERGRTIFLKNCVACHGPEGHGDGPVASKLTPKPPDLVAKMPGHHSDGDLAWKIENGRGPMPGWKDTLSANEIWDLTNYIKSLGQRSRNR